MGDLPLVAAFVAGFITIAVKPVIFRLRGFPTAGADLPVSFLVMGKAFIVAVGVSQSRNQHIFTHSADLIRILSRRLTGYMLYNRILFATNFASMPVTTFITGPCLAEFMGYGSFYAATVAGGITIVIIAVLQHFLFSANTASADVGSGAVIGPIVELMIAGNIHSSRCGNYLSVDLKTNIDFVINKLCFVLDLKG